MPPKQTHIPNSTLINSATPILSATTLLGRCLQPPHEPPFPKHIPSVAPLPNSIKLRDWVGRAAVSGQRRTTELSKKLWYSWVFSIRADPNTSQKIWKWQQSTAWDEEHLVLDVSSEGLGWDLLCHPYHLMSLTFPQMSIHLLTHSKYSWTPITTRTL